MNRETGYPFFELDADGLTVQLTALFEQITGAPVDAGGKVRLFLSWMASAILLLMAQANRAYYLAHLRPDRLMANALAQAFPDWGREAE